MGYDQDLQKIEIGIQKIEIGIKKKLSEFRVDF